VSARDQEEPLREGPAWFRELRGTLSISPQFVLEGNVHDRYLLPAPDGGLRPVPDLVEAVWRALQPQGCAALLVFDVATGWRAHPDDDSRRRIASAVLGRTLGPGRGQSSVDGLRDLLVRIVAQRDHHVALVIALAARLAPDPQRLTPEQMGLFVMAEHLALSAVPTARGADQRASADQRPVHNPIVWLVDRDRELPAWLLAHEDQVRSIAVPLPDYGMRAACAELLLKPLAGALEPEARPTPVQIERFTQQTEGMTLNAMFAIVSLARDHGRGVDGVEDAARAYRVGIVDNPWRTEHLLERLRRAEDTVGCVVLGQRDAVRKALDIMIRSATGLTGAHRSPYATRPRGVLFFAGPTGVGKTELAKQLTRLVFGDETAYVRFDMSEFSEEHTAARLIGAPPGYTGYDAGGELTNAIRRRPFGLILFDEVEKAHGRILDKFLQILEDGRLTDGRGATVFFSEAVLVFTSNLGIWVPGPDGERVENVTADMDRDEAEQRVLEAIRHHFTVVLGRPELLNRLGDNIVVFDFITRETGEEILALLVGTVQARVLREHAADLVLTTTAYAQLSELALANLENGGRGIGSVVENALVNPLARAIFERGTVAGDTLTVTAVTRHGRAHDVTLA
jgi:hypothetical protein